MTGLLKQDRRSSRDTLRRIVVAAKAEFGAKGLSGARIDDIAKRSGKTKQLIYHYYSSKEELYSEVVRMSHEESVRALLTIDYDRLSPKAALTALLSNIFTQYLESPDIGRLMLDENIHCARHFPSREWVRNMTQPLIAQLGVILDRGVETGDFKFVPDKGQFFAAALTLVTACFLTGNVTSRLVGVDMVSADGMRRWRDYSIGLLVSSLHPAEMEAPRLSRPAKMLEHAAFKPPVA